MVECVRTSPTRVPSATRGIDDDDELLNAGHVAKVAFSPRASNSSIAWIQTIWYGPRVSLTSSRHHEARGAVPYAGGLHSAHVLM